jgi:hypothetical protein
MRNWFGALALLVASPAAAQGCDRACLEDIAGKYLAALVSHDAKSAPLSPDVRFTENGQALGVNDALWATAGKLRDYHLVVADVPGQSIALYQVLEEANVPILLAARLKVVDRRITEIETVVNRPDRGSPARIDTIDRQPIFETALPASARVSRDRLAAIANSYFQGLAEATDKITPFDDRCFRRENGARTANNPEGQGMAKMGCQAQFATGFSKFITNFRERRFVAIDEERGVVMAIGFFDHAGTVPTVKLADGSTLTVPPPFNRPFTFELFELFKVENGRIRQIEAVLNTVPYGMASGWLPGRN